MEENPLRDLESLFAQVQAESERRVEKGHGRLEIREDWTIRDRDILEHLDPDQKWKGLQALGMVRAERRIGQEVSRETRYFLLSFSSGRLYPNFQTTYSAQAAKASVSTRRSKSARGICTVSASADDTKKKVEGQRC